MAPDAAHPHIQPILAGILAQIESAASGLRSFLEHAEDQEHQSGP